MVGCGAAAALSESLIVVARGECDAPCWAGGVWAIRGDVGGGDSRVDVVDGSRLCRGRFKNMVVVLDSSG